MRVTRINFVGGWGTRLAKSYDGGTDTLTIEIHSTIPDEIKQLLKAAKPAQKPITFGTSDPASPVSGDWYLNTFTKQLCIFDGVKWWRSAMAPSVLVGFGLETDTPSGATPVKTGGGLPGFDPIRHDMFYPVSGWEDTQTPDYQVAYEMLSL